MTMVRLIARWGMPLRFLIDHELDKGEKKLMKKSKAMLKLVKLKKDIKELVQYDGHRSPPDWGAFICELIDILMTEIEDV